MNPTIDQEAQVHALMLSPTMHRLLGLARALPLDVQDREALHTGLCTSSVDLVLALDAGRLHFDQDEDRAMLHALLMIAMEIIFDGRFAARCTTEVGHA